MKLFKNKILKRLLRIFAWLAALGIAAICLLLEFFWIEHKTSVTLPVPTGRYAVGRVENHWVDATRMDSLAPISGTNRELPVWIWYPADASQAQNRPAAPYLPEAWRTAVENEQGVLMSDFLTRDLSRVHAHAIENAPMSSHQVRYPVLLFKAGIGALSTDYTSLCEDLASHGYIVVASDAPYSTYVVVQNNGTLATRTLAGNPGDDRASPAEAKRISDNLVPIWSADLRFELDELGKLNKNDPSNRFTDRLNLDEVGVFGHSFGGASALQFCHDDPRCRAGIDIDGRLFGNAVQTGLDKPFLFLMSDHAGETDPESQGILGEIQSVSKTLPNWPNQITILGTRHFNFTDMALLKEHFISKLMLGPIDRRRALSITAEYVRAFFDTHLKNASDVLMNGPSTQNPEVALQPK